MSTSATIDRRLRNTALLVAACFFMENLDGTIVITAAPRIGRALGVPATSVSLVIAAYLVTLAVLIPLSGWLAARWGHARCSWRRSRSSPSRRWAAR